MKNEFIPTILCLITKVHQCNELLFLELFKARPRVELLVERPPLVREALVIQGTPPPWFVMLQQVVILLPGVPADLLVFLVQHAEQSRCPEEEKTSRDIFL